MLLLSFDDQLSVFFRELPVGRALAPARFPQYMLQELGAFISWMQERSPLDAKQMNSSGAAGWI
jgi:hypothetical protein